MLRDIIIIFMLCFSSFIIAQNTDGTEVLHGLEVKFKKAKTAKEKVSLLVQIADYWSYRDTLIALKKIQQSEKIAGNNPYLEAINYYGKASVFFETHPEKSRRLYMQAEDIFSKYDTKESYNYRAKLWHNYGALEQREANDKAFLEINLAKCIPFAEKAGNTELLASFYTDVGLVLNNFGENQKALAYLQKASDLQTKPIKKPEFYAWTKLNYADVLLDLKRTKEAKVQLDEAGKALKNRDKSPYLTFFYQILSKYNSQIGKDNLAFENIDEGIKIAKELNLLGYETKMLFYSKFLLLKKNGKNIEAKELITSLLETLPPQDFNRRYTITKDVAKLEADFGNYKEAYSYLRAAQDIADSLNNRKDKEAINKMEVEFRTIEKEKKLLIAENNIKQQKLIYIGTTLFLLCILCFFFYSLHQSKQHEKRKVALVNKKKDIEVSQAIIEGEEHERRRIAKELHDGIGGRITALKMKVEAVASGGQKCRSEDIVQQMDSLLKELRQISKNLMPETILKLGLHDAISYFCENNSTKRTEIFFYGNNLQEISDNNQKLNIYRIVQELIANAIKHAKATEISVQVTKENKILLIDVEDNGIGMERKQAPDSLGLNNVRQRVNALNGKVNIVSEKNKGTYINITCKL